MIETLWTSGSRNVKTGDIPTGWIGATREQAQQSCTDVACPLRRRADGGNGQCYAWHGSPTFAFSSMLRARARGKAYDFGHAIADRRASAKMVRLGALGDPASISALGAAFIVSKARKAGLSLVGYTHGWRTAKQWRGRLMASCDSLEECDQALADGWRATVVIPWDHKGRRFRTPKGATGIVCPAQVKEGLTCNDCRLCDGSKRGPVIGFLDHGPQARRASKPAPSLEDRLYSLRQDIINADETRRRLEREREEASK